MPWVQKSETFDKELYVKDVVVNVKGNHPAVVVRNADILDGRRLIGVMQMKLQMLEGVRVLSVLDWEKEKSSEYFKRILN